MIFNIELRQGKRAKEDEVDFHSQAFLFELFEREVYDINNVLHINDC